jgi:hypothetical protein
VLLEPERLPVSLPLRGNGSFTTSMELLVS